MKGVLFLGNRKVVVKDFPDPEPGPGQAVVRMKASGICGSDMHRYRMSLEELKKGDELSKKLFGLIPGHEPSGIVEEVGEGVQNVKEGDRVMVYHATGCGHCPQCLDGYMMYCKDSWLLGTNVHGPDADFLLVPALGCLRLPEELSFVDGAVMACAGGTAYQIIRNLGITGRETLAIYGLGPLGECATMTGKGMGAHVIGVEVSEERLKMGKRLGADEVVNAKEENPVEVIKSLTRGRGADAAIDFSGKPVAQNNALDSVKTRGKVGFIGAGPPNELLIHPTDIFIRRGLTLTGCWIFKISTYDEMVNFLVDRGIHFEDTVTHRFSLEEASEAFRLFDTGKTGKIVFQW